MTLPLAHAAHWYHALLYVVPVILIGAALWWSGRRDSRERDECAASPPDGSDQD